MITFIVEFCEDSFKKTKSFLLNLSDIVEEIKDAEVIFITKSDKMCPIDEIVIPFMNSNPLIKTKIIYSSKTLSLNKQIKYSTKISSTDYVWFINPLVKYNKTMVLNVVNILRRKEIDLVEIRPELCGLIKWEPKSRHDLKPSTRLKIDENEKIVAYAFPFIQNKVFSKKSVMNVLENNKIINNIDISSSLSIEFLYLFLLEAKTYAWISNGIVPINISEGNIPYYKHLFDEWSRVQKKYLEENRLISELKYAEAYHLLIIISSLYGIKSINSIFNESQVFKKKYHAKLMKLWQSDMEFFDIENKYMVNKNNENILLRHVQPINKWSKLLANLENK